MKDQNNNRRRKANGKDVDKKVDDFGINEKGKNLDISSNIKLSSPNSSNSSSNSQIHNRRQDSTKSRSKTRNKTNETFKNPSISTLVDSENVSAVVVTPIIAYTKNTRKSYVHFILIILFFITLYMIYFIIFSLSNSIEYKGYSYPNFNFNSKKVDYNNGVVSNPKFLPDPWVRFKFIPNAKDEYDKNKNSYLKRNSFKSSVSMKELNIPEDSYYAHPIFQHLVGFPLFKESILKLVKTTNQLRKQIKNPVQLTKDYSPNFSESLRSSFYTPLFTTLLNDFIDYFESKDISKVKTEKEIENDNLDDELFEEEHSDDPDLANHYNNEETTEIPFNKGEFITPLIPPLGSLLWFTKSDFELPSDRGIHSICKIARYLNNGKNNVFVNPHNEQHWGFHGNGATMLGNDEFTTFGKILLGRITMDHLNDDLHRCIKDSDMGLSFDGENFWIDVAKSDIGNFHDDSENVNDDKFGKRDNMKKDSTNFKFDSKFESKYSYTDVPKADREYTMALFSAWAEFADRYHIPYWIDEELLFVYQYSDRNIRPSHMLEFSPQISVPFNVIPDVIDILASKDAILPKVILPIRNRDGKVIEYKSLTSKLKVNTDFYLRGRDESASIDILFTTEDKDISKEVKIEDDSFDIPNIEKDINTFHKFPPLVITGYSLKDRNSWIISDKNGREISLKSLIPLRRTYFPNIPYSNEMDDTYSNKKNDEESKNEAVYEDILNKRDEMYSNDDGYDYKSLFSLDRQPIVWIPNRPKDLIGTVLKIASYKTDSKMRIVQGGQFKDMRESQKEDMYLLYKNTNFIDPHDVVEDQFFENSIKKIFDEERGLEMEEVFITEDDILHHGKSRISQTELIEVPTIGTPGGVACKILHGIFTNDIDNLKKKHIHFSWDFNRFGKCWAKLNKYETIGLSIKIIKSSVFSFWI